LVNVLFVCLGNICRSPTAEGVFRALVEREGLAGKIATDSAGTAAYHVGEPPDPRAQAAARQRGVDIGDLRGRQATAADFGRFDYVLAMDESNYVNLKRLCPKGAEGRLRMFLDFASKPGRRSVPDPFYGNTDRFEEVLDMVEDAAHGLLDHIRRTDL
jgi:protein-tyrosine phosphatase